MKSALDLLANGEPTFRSKQKLLAFPQNAPIPHCTPHAWIDEYELAAGNFRRQEMMNTILADHARRSGRKFLHLGKPPTAPSFPVSGLPAALQA